MARPTSIAAFAILALVTAAACVFAQTLPATTQSNASGSGSGDRVTTPSGLTIVTQRKSEGAKVGDVIKILYTGRLKTTGKVFDTTADRGDEPIRVTLGEGRVIKGWEEGLLGMQFGEKRTLIIPPELAWGAAGRGNAIPPNAAVEFDIEIVGIERPRAP